MSLSLDAMDYDFASFEGGSPETFPTTAGVMASSNRTHSAIGNISAFGLKTANSRSLSVGGGSAAMGAYAEGTALPLNPGSSSSVPNGGSSSSSSWEVKYSNGICDHLRRDAVRHAMKVVAATVPQVLLSNGNSASAQAGSSMPVGSPPTARRRTTSSVSDDAFLGNAHAIPSVNTAHRSSSKLHARSNSGAEDLYSMFGFGFDDSMYVGGDSIVGINGPGSANLSTNIASSGGVFLGALTSNGLSNIQPPVFNGSLIGSIALDTQFGIGRAEDTYILTCGTAGTRTCLTRSCIDLRQAEAQCTICDFRGRLDDAIFIQHFNTKKHNVALRLTYPFELHCMRCNDFVYQAEFDRKIHKRRYEVMKAHQKLKRMADNGVVDASSSLNAQSQGKQSPSTYPDTSSNTPPVATKVTRTVSNSSSSSGNSGEVVVDEFERSTRRRTIDLSYDRFAVCGLVNMGNTCFLNSVLQALVLSNPIIMRYFTGLNVGRDGLVDTTLNEVAMCPPHSDVITRSSTAVNTTSTLCEPLSGNTSSSACIACAVQSMCIAAKGAFGDQPMRNSTLMSNAPVAATRAGHDSSAVGLKSERLRSPPRSQTIAGSSAGNTSPVAQDTSDTGASKITSASTSPISSQAWNTSIYSSDASTTTLVPSNLLFAIWSMFPHLASYEQHDAHELLVALLDGLSSHLQDFHDESNAVLQAYVDPKAWSATNVDMKTRSPSEALTYVQRLLQLGATSAVCAVSSDASKGDAILPNSLSDSQRKSLLRQVQSTGLFKFEGIVNEVFSGVLRSIIECTACNHKSMKYEPFRDISVSIENVPASEVNVAFLSNMQQFLHVDETTGELVDNDSATGNNTKSSSSSSNNNNSSSNSTSSTSSSSKEFTIAVKEESLEHSLNVLETSITVSADTTGSKTVSLPLVEEAGLVSHRLESHTPPKLTRSLRSSGNLAGIVSKAALTGTATTGPSGSTSGDPSLSGASDASVPTSASPAAVGARKTSASSGAKRRAKGSESVESPNKNGSNSNSSSGSRSSSRNSSGNDSGSSSGGNNSDQAEVTSIGRAVTDHEDSFSDTHASGLEGAAADGEGRGGRRAAVVAKCLSLVDCMNHFVQKEQIGFHMKCEHCNAHGYIQKSMSISTPPNVLILHLKRFDGLGKNKIRTYVSFPMRGFNVGAFAATHSVSNVANAVDANLLLYDLHAVITHKGQSLTEGHYVSYVKSPRCMMDKASNQWLRCNDDQITEVNEMEVQMAQAYILIYVNRATTVNLNLL